MVNTFGEYLKNLRLSREKTLRAFSEEVGIEPGNYSKIERGKLAPPRDPAKLEPYRRALGLAPDSTEWREAVRLAALSRGEIPPDILSNEQLMGRLPALFRTIEGAPISGDVLDELIQALKRE